MESILAFLVAARRCEVRELEQLARSCALVQAVSELVHRVQAERGCSNLHLASGGTRFETERTACAAASVEAEAAVRAWLDQADILDPAGERAPAGGARLFTRIALALHGLDALPGLRATIAAGRCAPREATQRFTQVIAALLELVFEAADVAADPAISRVLVALFNLMQGKEFAGQERAAGAAAFAAGGMGRAPEPDLLQLIELQEACLERFATFCPPEVRSAWDAARQAMPLAELERLRRKLLAAGQGGALPATLAEPWFACCSARLDHLRAIEDLLAGGLRSACAARIAALQRDPDDPEALLRMLEEAAEGRPELSADPFGPRLTRSIVDVLQAQSRRLQAMSEQLAAARASLDERKLIDRAKAALMHHQGLSEDAAYRLMRQTAMNQGRRLPDVARAVIELEPLLPGAPAQPDTAQGGM
ncbi:MAG: nitrate- and nitrite sensing domain-containing protein [Thauera sp.]